MEPTYKYLYALKCVGEKYYIGQTNDIIRRFIQHKEQGKEGSVWTSMYKVVEIVETWEIKDFPRNDALVLEDKMTLEYINKYGPKNVRGGKYIFADLDHHLRLLDRYNELIDGRYVSRATTPQVERFAKSLSFFAERNPDK